MRFYNLTVRSEIGPHQQFTLLSKDLPASFRPYYSAAQLAAADAPRPLVPPAHGLSRALTAPRLSSSTSKLLEPTAAHSGRQQLPQRVSMATVHKLIEELRQHEAERRSLDPFARAFSADEPTRVLASRRDEVRSYLDRWPEQRRTPVDSDTAGELPALVLSLSLSGFAQPGDAGAAGPAFERRKRAAMKKLWREHEYAMRGTLLKDVKQPRLVAPPPPTNGRVPVDRLQLERDASRLMRKLIMRPRSHTF
ncbi:hypothetical protein T492DRAFT_1003270, partial [Pavlovales sp. CCMP2436]